SQVPKRAVENLLTAQAGVGEIALGVEVVDADSGARHDVVEVIEEDALPDVFEREVVVRASAQVCERGELLRVLQQLLVVADEALGFGLRGVAAAVILQVKFVVPIRRIQAALLDALEHVVEELTRGAENSL